MLKLQNMKKLASKKCEAKEQRVQNMESREIAAFSSILSSLDMISIFDREW